MHRGSGVCGSVAYGRGMEIAFSTGLRYDSLDWVDWTRETFTSFTSLAIRTYHNVRALFFCFAQIDILTIKSKISGVINDLGRDAPGTRFDG